MKATMKGKMPKHPIMEMKKAGAFKGNPAPKQAPKPNSDIEQMAKKAKKKR